MHFPRFFFKKKQRSTNNETNTNDELTNNHVTTNHETHPKTVDQSSVTDESSFGSCEPGTNVVLQGIVWNETDKGKLHLSICNIVDSSFQMY